MGRWAGMTIVMSCLSSLQSALSEKNKEASNDLWVINVIQLAVLYIKEGNRQGQF